MTCLQERPTTACIFDEIKWSNNYSMLKQFLCKRNYPKIIKYWITILS
jgi:hypothetical protein